MSSVPYYPPSRVPPRYLAGMVLAEMDSRTEWGDTDADYLLKRLIVVAVKNDTGSYDLIAVIEVEVCVEKDEDGFIDLPSAEVYRIPFPYGSVFRKSIIRQWIKEPKFQAR